MALINKIWVIVIAFIGSLLAAFKTGIDRQKNKQTTYTLNDILQTEKRRQDRNRVTHADKLKWLRKYDKSK